MANMQMQDKLTEVEKLVINLEMALLDENLAEAMIFAESIDRSIRAINFSKLQDHDFDVLNFINNKYSDLLTSLNKKKAKTRDELSNSIASQKAINVYKSF